MSDNTDGNWHAPIYSIGNEIADNTEMWRYVRLSTLLTLLTDRVFIPSIETLQREDPTEASVVCRATNEHLKNLPDADKNTLLEYATETEKARYEGSMGADHLETFRKIWIRYLSQRRCAWCWHLGNLESMSQWRIYARDGVAISTTPRKMRAAISATSIRLGLLGRVEYQDESVQLPEQFFMRPYFLKRKGFRHEEEVRLILPREASQGAGIQIPIHGRKLISQVRISPFLPWEEAKQLREALDRILNFLPGEPVSDIDHIAPVVSNAFALKSGNTWEDLTRSLPTQTGIANLGKQIMPSILGDDLLREVVPDVE